MSRSKKDVLDTEAMLTRLTNLLVEHRKPDGGWRATCLAPGDAKHLTTLTAPTLVEMSMKLEAVEA